MKVTSIILVAAVLCAAAAPALADPPDWAPAHGWRSHEDDGARYAWARVVDAQPIYAAERQPVSRQVCYQQPGYEVQRTRYVNPNQGPATLLGAIIGGALGNTAGHGDGRAAATIAGAVIGGAIGNNATRDDGYYQSQQGYVPGYQDCRVQTQWRRQNRVIGYDVTYRYDGRTYRTRTPYDPGERLRVRVDQYVTPVN
jgi:uncharacterized protein YcfJ